MRSGVVLCVVRCGETSWAAEGRLRGSTDIPLSPAGRERVRMDVLRTARLHQSVATVWHPTDEAAADTAKAFAARWKARAKPAPELGDPNLGLLEGLTVGQFAERYPTRYRQWEEDVWSFAAPEGEAVSNASQRMLAEVARIVKRSRSAETAVVLHDLALGVLRCWLAEQPFSAWQKLTTSRPSVERYLLSQAVVDELKAAARP